MKNTSKRFVLLLLAAGCVGDSRAQTAGDGGTAVSQGWRISQLSNLSRLPGLKPTHKALLAKQGFFLAPQDPPPRPKTVRPKAPDRPAADSSLGATEQRTQATHLFHVYERNDYLRFPSFITVDLAIDTTHAYFDAVLRDIEQYQLGPLLVRALTEMVNEAENLRATATTENGRAVAHRTALFWAVALRLEKNKAAIPKALQEETEKLVKAIVAGAGPLPVDVVKAPFDVTQTRPRGHYTRTKALERFFRSMSWLGMAAFPVEGKHVDVEGVALLARTWLGSKAGRESIEKLMTVTTFFAGGADSAGLGAAAAVLERVVAGASAATADQLVAPDVLARFQKQLVAALPAPRMWSGDPGGDRQVRVLGRRAFKDAVAMQNSIPALMQFASPTNLSGFAAATMGARGAAAVLGSSIARESLLADVPGPARAEVGAGLAKGQASLAAVTADRWSQDAYHGTLLALRTLLEPPSSKVPPLVATEAWRLRALQAFASGWAELRHDTILYGEQSGAECDAEDFEPPPCWVEPVPELYRRLGAMVRELEKRLGNAGLNLGLHAKVKVAPVFGEAEELTTNVDPPAEKTKILLGFLDRLVKVAEIELKGGKLDRATLDWMTTIGGAVEWLLMTFSNSEMLNERDADMAVVADVFTWRSSGQVLEVGVARPELIYAVIPSAKGPVLARGAIMPYREFMHPQAARMTDEEWRKIIAAGKSPARPAWLAPIYAEAVGPVKMPKVPQHRCGPSSGASLECL